MALDTSDNCYVTGHFDDTNNFGGVNLTNQSIGGSDIFVAKYNSVGALQWAQRAGGVNFNNGRGIGVDTNGNIYVTGGVYGPANFGNINLPSSSYENFFLAKYSSSGVVQWVRQSAGGVGNIYGTILAVDGAGNSYALMFVDNYQGGATLTFGSVNMPIPAQDGLVTVLIKYNGAGTAQWAQLLGSSNEVFSTAIAIDTIGNVYVNGIFEADIEVGSSNLSGSPGATKNLFIAKFSNSGALTWIQQPKGGVTDGGGVAVDPAGNVYFSGAFNTNLNFGAGIILTNHANSSGALGGAFVARYNSSGMIQWAQLAGGTNAGAYLAVALDGQTNVYSAGALNSQTTIAKYSPTGTLQWIYSANNAPASPVGSAAINCVVDPNGHCYLDGWYQEAATFSTNTLQPLETWNFFLTEVAAYSSYSFGSEVQSTSTATSTHNSGTGTFQYTDAATSTEDQAYLPLSGSAAAFITTSNGWTASLAANILSSSLPCASGRSDHVVMGLGFINGFPTNVVFIFLAQENNTGGGDDSIYPHGWYGTAVRFLANKNRSVDATTPLGNSLPSSNGSVYLPLSGGTNAVAGTESISAASGTLTLNYNVATKTVTSYYDGTPVGSYSLAGWGLNPPLTLVVWGGSGSGVDVPAGTDTANNFFAGMVPQMAVVLSGGNVLLTWPTNTAGYTLQSTTNLSSGGWNPVSPSPIGLNGQNTVTNVISSPQMFYRLSQ
jgi:hypothetical protein